MKKSLFLIGTILISNVQSVLCATAVAEPELANSLKVTSNEPNIMSILFALLFVIFLIYVTGLIYSKLNLVGSKAIKQQLKNYDVEKAVVISTTQLGQGKNLHVIELNNKHYLIGATPNSINLIKELEIKKSELPKDEKSEEAQIDDAISVLYGLEEKEEVIVEEEFDVHKKYL